MAWFVLIALFWLLFTTRYLGGENLGYLDSKVLPQPVGEPSEAHHGVVASLANFGNGAAPGTRERIQSVRKYLDAISDGREFDSEFRPLEQGWLRGEWVLGPGANPRRRILYIHGGAFYAGSPKSHRSMTDRLSRLLDAAVFSLDYRLMPEHRRQDGIDDCRNAYRWILANGPEGAEELDFLLVAGDSAGGNLTLSTIAWARDEGLRAADAVVAFSPSTDSTLESPSWRSNLASDPMLGPGFGKLLKLPRPLLLWLQWLRDRIRPLDPRVSPLRGDLSGLPPVLVQASEAEMLFDDARRYVARAEEAGSPALLQTWPYMVHVWQIFNPELPEAEEAFANVAEFVASAVGAEDPACT